MGKRADHGGWRAHYGVCSWFLGLSGGKGKVIFWQRIARKLIFPVLWSCIAIPSKVPSTQWSFVKNDVDDIELYGLMPDEGLCHGFKVCGQNHLSTRKTSQTTQNHSCEDHLFHLTYFEWPSEFNDVIKIFAIFQWSLSSKMFSSCNVLTPILARLGKPDFRTWVLVLIMTYSEAVGQTRKLKRKEH